MHRRDVRRVERVGRSDFGWGEFIISEAFGKEYYDNMAIFCPDVRSGWAIGYGGRVERGKGELFKRAALKTWTGESGGVIFGTRPAAGTTLFGHWQSSRRDCVPSAWAVRLCACVTRLTQKKCPGENTQRLQHVPKSGPLPRVGRCCRRFARCAVHL